MIKCCIFDLDGTLLNTIDAITYYVNLVLEANGINPISTEEAKIFVGDGSKNLIRRVLIFRGEYRSEEFFEHLHTEYKTNYDKAPLYITEPYGGIPELKVALKRRGIKLGVLSNKPHSAVLPIVEHFFGDAFDLVLGANQNVPLKPDPTGLFAMLDELSVKPSELAFIGDTAVDIETARAAGAALSVGVLWGFRDENELVGAGADVTVSRAMEILELIK